MAAGAQGTEVSICVEAAKKISKKVPPSAQRSVCMGY
jgi:hypothetical protein